MTRQPFSPGASALLLVGTLGALTACTSSAPVRAQHPWQSLDVLVGLREYGDLEPVEEQTTLGLEYVHERPGDAFGWNLGLDWAREDGSEPDGGGGSVEVEAEVAELYAGLRRSFDTSSPLRPYVGVGMTLIRVDTELSGTGGSSSDDDLTTGAYLRAGLLLDVSDRLHLGLDARTVFWTDLDLEGVRWDADHGQVALVAGFSF